MDHLKSFNFCLLSPISCYNSLNCCDCHSLLQLLSEPSTGKWLFLGDDDWIQEMLELGPSCWSCLDQAVRCRSWQGRDGQTNYYNLPTLSQLNYTNYSDVQRRVLCYQQQHHLFFSLIGAINVCLLCSNRLEEPAAKVVCMDLTLFIDKLDEIAVIYYFPRFIASLVRMRQT